MKKEVYEFYFVGGVRLTFILPLQASIRYSQPIALHVIIVPAVTNVRNVKGAFFSDVRNTVFYPEKARDTNAALQLQLFLSQCSEEELQLLLPICEAIIYRSTQGKEIK